MEDNLYPKFYESLNSSKAKNSEITIKCDMKEKNK